MVAAPQYATAIFLGLQTGKTYAVDMYLSDVANADVNWDSGNGAGASSLTYWKAPENVVFQDLAINTGMTDTTNIALTSDGAQIPGARLRFAQHVNTIATRPKLQIGFKMGSNVGAIQIA